MPFLTRFLLLFLVGCYTAAAGTGTVIGKLELENLPENRRIAVEKYTGKISGKVAPPPPNIAGVWLSGPKQAATPLPKKLVLNQKNYQFGKSLIVIPLGSTVTFPNDDPDYHNVFSLSRGKRFDLGRYKMGEKPAPSVKFEKEGLIKLNCEIHEHMKAHILVVNSKHYAATDSAGNFKLTGIPPGTYTLHGQLDRKHVWKTTVTVASGQTTTATFSKSKSRKKR